MQLTINLLVLDFAPQSRAKVGIKSKLNSVVKLYAILPRKINPTKANTQSSNSRPDCNIKLNRFARDGITQSAHKSHH